MSDVNVPQAGSVKTAFEIQRMSYGGFGMVRAAQPELAAVSRELAAIKQEDPKGAYRVLERTERVVPVNELLSF